MADELNIDKGMESKLPKIKLSGRLMFTDNGNLYLDYDNNTRLKISDVNIMNKDSKNLKDENNPIENKLYVCLLSKDIWTYSNNKWIKVTYNENKFYQIESELKSTISKSDINDSNIIKGSIIIDNHNSIGIITDVNDENISIKILIDNQDKLSSTKKNYHIVESLDELNNIDTDATRKKGTMAYVQNEDLIYIWTLDEADEMKWMPFNEFLSQSSQ